ncbi:MAG: hypothetical protein Q9207_004376 [Kuettlingeria erythrocarpa]
MKSVLAVSCLSQHELEDVWQRTQSINALGLREGFWTLLEIYVALHFVQSLERLSFDQMAIQFAGSTPPEVTNQIRRTSSYIKTGLSLPPGVDDDTMPTSSSPALTAVLKRSVSNATGLTEMTRLCIEEESGFGDDALSSQPGLEVPDLLHSGSLHHSGRPRRIRRDSSQRTTSTIGAQRLAALIQSRCPNIEREPEIAWVQSRPIKASIIDTQSANDILIRNRRQNPAFTDPSKSLRNKFKTKQVKQRLADPATWRFEPHELSLALRQVVAEEAMGNAGVAKALIDLGADVNVVRRVHRSRLKGSSVVSEPMNYARIAASHNNLDMVYLFATTPVLPANLVAALEQAIEQNLPRIVLALLQLGVDWSARGEQILGKAITAQNPTLVKYLVRSRSATHGDLLTKSLQIAVDQGQIEIVSLLVTYGARTTVEHLSALRKAVQLQRIDIVLAIMKGIDTSGRGQVASSVVGDAYLTSSLLSVDEQRLLIEVLLCAGAKGDPVAQTLLHAVRARHRSIARLLIKHGADLRFHNAEALRITMASKDLDMISTLLLGGVPKEIAGDVMDEIPHSCSDNQTYDMISLLVAKGARGGPLDTALVQAVQHGRNRTVGLLLDHGADINHKSCQPIRMAVTGSDVVTLKLLLTKGRPDPKVMQDLIPLIPRSPLGVTLAVVEAIINAAGQHKIDTAVLNGVLIEALRRPSQDEIDKFLIPLVDFLITTGASVDVQQGKCFRLAAATGSLKLMELLISGMSDPTSLSPAVEVSRKIGDPGRRRDFLCTLAKHGAKGREIDQALVDAIEEVPVDRDLLHVLLGIADLDYLDGRALVVAIRLPSPTFVAFVIDTGRTSCKIRLNAWQTLHEPRVTQRRTKANILLQAGISQEGLDKALVQEIGGERDSHIVKLLLDQKASCDYDGGKSLALAIRHHDGDILEQLVTKCSKRRTVQAMVPNASAIQEEQLRLRCFGLLIRGGATGGPLSQALLQEVEAPGHRSLQIIQFLVHNGAQIDYLDAKAIKFVVSAPLGVDLLKILLSATATLKLITTLIPLVLNHPQDIRLPLLQVLLDHGAEETSLNETLVSMVSEGTTAQTTIDLLLKYGASVNHCRAQAVKIAAGAKSTPVLRCLLNQNPHNEFLEEAIPAAMQLPSRPSGLMVAERLHTIRLLTKKLTNPSVADESLIQAVREGDIELIEHWMKCGANPNFKDGRSVIAATQRLDIRALKHLFCSKNKPTSTTCSRAFAAMPTNDTGAPVDHTFLSAVKSTHELAAEFILLVLDNRTPLDVNFEGGKGLCIATIKARVEIITYLLQQTPNAFVLHAGFMSIFESAAEEQVLIQIAREFFACPHAKAEIYFRQDEFTNDALYQLLHRHNDKPTLLQELLANGCRSDSRFQWEFSDSYGTEYTSALLWLLCQGDESIDVGLVDILLNHGSDPNFRTARSCISPLTMAASLGRGDIVSKLLQKGADPDAHDGTDSSPLEYATMAGDIESMGYIIQYKSVGHDNLNDELLDESLHVAARKLDVAAIRLLLEHSFRTDLPGPVHAGGRIALAEACRMGDATVDSSQLKKVLALLCKATADLQVRTHGKSMLSEMALTKALISFPKTRTVTASRLTFATSNVWERELIAVLTSLNAVALARLVTHQSLNVSYMLMDDRFWDSDAGASQPTAYCNPPLAIVNAIKEAEAERRAQAHKDQVRREIEAADEAERRQEDERLKRRQEERAAERRAVEERTAVEVNAIEQKARAESIMQRRLAEAEASRAEADRRREEREYKDRRAREREEQDEKERRERERNRRAEATLKERKNIQIDQKRRESNLRKETLREEKKVLEERRRLADSMGGMFREAQYAGVNKISAGRILGEIEDKASD